MKNLTDANIKREFRLSYDAGVADAKKNMGFVFRVDTDQPNGETFGGTTGVHGMTERKGDTVYETLTGITWTLQNRLWTQGIIIPRTSWLYNKTADVTWNIQQLATLASGHPAELVETVITTGKSTTYPKDSEYFFDTDHPRGIDKDGTALSDQAN